MTWAWQSAAVAVLGAAALAAASVAITVARRTRADWKELARRVDEISLRVRAIGSGASREDDPAPYPPPQGGRVKNPGSRPLKPSPLAGEGRVGGGPSLRLDLPSAMPGPTLIAVPSMAAPGSETIAHDAAEALSRRYGPIWDLADAGEAPSAIAHTTGQPIGHVELILALRRQADGPKSGEAVPHG